MRVCGAEAVQSGCEYAPDLILLDGMMPGTEGATEAAGKLRAEGLIQYSLGPHQGTDSAKPQHRVCAYYAEVKNEFDRPLLYKIPGPQNTTAQALPASR